MNLLIDFREVQLAFEHHKPRSDGGFLGAFARSGVLSSLERLREYLVELGALAEACNDFLHTPASIVAGVVHCNEVACDVLLALLPRHVHEDVARRGRLDAAGLQSHIFETYAGWTQQQILSRVLSPDALKLYAAAYVGKRAVLAQIDLPPMDPVTLRLTLLALDGTPGLEVVRRVDDPDHDFEVPPNLSYVVEAFVPSEPAPLVPDLPRDHCVLS
jgi:hypothetical protein